MYTLVLPRKNFCTGDTGCTIDAEVEEEEENSLESAFKLARREIMIPLHLDTITESEHEYSFVDSQVSSRAASV